MRLPWAHVAKHIKMSVLNHQSFAVLIEKKPHFRPGGRISEQERVFHNLIEVEKFYGLHRPPYFLPTSREVWTIKHIDQGPFQGRNPQFLTGSLCGRNTEIFFPRT
ncbi:hypothetical protein DSCOOX_12030 [Desulfosarcina ovata subsp. ovata]|uniref:Uncharacterized protein n=1 Tax=Desulfosarcina ovata subsp. ovata TaxID=2752305 RepID=A0A5K8A5Y2_9BACT|nr:hypothetical protein DSCOOX_12030 [Desulfosarcina ovata subsp. ovata]